MPSICQTLESQEIFLCHYHWASGAAGKRGIGVMDTADLLRRVYAYTNYSVTFRESKDDYMTLSSGDYAGRRPFYFPTDTTLKRKILGVQTDTPIALRYLDAGTTYNFIEPDHPTMVFLLGGGIAPSNEFRVSDTDSNSRVTYGVGQHNSIPCNTELNTHIASLISGKHFGVAKNARIIQISLMDGCGNDVRSSKVIQALDWILQNSLTYKKVVVAIPLQISGESKMVVEDMVSQMLAAGIVVIAAAGNAAENACEYAPASVPGVIVVAAADMTNLTSAVPWESSNFGPCVTIWAPGKDIQGSNGVGNTSSTFSGTAQAMGLVVGLAATIENDFTVKGVIGSLIKSSSNKVMDFVPPGTTRLFAKFIPFANNTCT